LSSAIISELLIGNTHGIVNSEVRSCCGNGECQFEPKSELEAALAKTVSMIGIDPGELVWVRKVLFLLRHPDPVVAEMARQTLLYLERKGDTQTQAARDAIEHAG
jgi:hypothetical protein